MVMVPALLSAAMLLLLPGTLTETYNSENKSFPIEVIVQNGLLGTSNNFSTRSVHGGILLGALENLRDSNADFKFNYTVNRNFGPYLQSVNGVAGNDKDHTYWQLLVKTQDSNIPIRPDVGIGCYIPRANEQIILNFTKW